MNDRTLAGLAADGFEHLGTIEVAGALVLGDPAFLGADRPEPHRPWHGEVKAGTWHLFVRADEYDTNTIAELVACHADVLERFFDCYDEAQQVDELMHSTGRVALLDADERDDAALRGAMLEPDPDALPWVVDRGCVTTAGREPGAFPVHAFTEGVAVLVSAAFVP